MNSSSSLSISFLHWSIAAGAIPASPVPIELARVHQAIKMAHFRGKIGSLLGAPLDQIGAPSSGHGHLINMQSKSRAAIEKAGQDKERSGGPPFLDAHNFGAFLGIGQEAKNRTQNRVLTETRELRAEP